MNRLRIPMMFKTKKQLKNDFLPTAVLSPFTLVLAVFKGFRTLGVLAIFTLIPDLLPPNTSSAEGFERHAFARGPGIPDGSLRVEQAKVHYVFIPEGFDDNDDVELVIDGYLPTSCYKILDPLVSIDQDSYKIHIEPRSGWVDNPNIPCLEALVPYFVIVKLGVLPQGNYTVRVNQSDLAAGADLIEKLTIRPAKSHSQDNVLYAPVDSVQIHRDEGGHQFALLEGRLTNSCMEFKEIVLEDHGPTLNLLPKIRMRPGTGEKPCITQETFYTKRVALPESLKAGRHLLHVRSLNGSAINTLFYVRPWD